VNDIAPSRYKWVGTRPVRPDGVPKVTGRALYGADLAMAGALYGKIIRSPHAHARIRSIDASKALALPGVKAVVTAADFPDHKFEYLGPERVAQNFWHITRNVMAREKALYEGHAVAAVAAASVLALAGFAIANFGTAQTAAQRIAFVFTTGSTGGTYFPVGQAIAGIVSHPPGIARCDAPGACGPAGLVASVRSR